MAPAKTPAGASIGVVGAELRRIQEIGGLNDGFW